MLWLKDQEVRLVLPDYSTTCHVGKEKEKYLIEHGISTNENEDTTEENVFNINDELWKIAKYDSHITHLINRKMKHNRDSFKFPDVYRHLLVAKDQLKQAKRNVSDAEYYVRVFLGEALGINQRDIEIGSHECIKSPIRTCVYNDAEDDMHDFCLYCGDPNERK